MSEARDRYYTWKDEINIPLCVDEYVEELESENEQLKNSQSQKQKIKLHEKIEQLEKYKNELFGENEQLKKEKWELISVIKATAELIDKFEMYNEMSFEILFQHIENILTKHGVTL